jgi:glycogen(starch) synthase
MAENPAYNNKCKILLVKDCSDEDLVCHLNAITKEAQLQAMTVLIPENTSRAFLERFQGIDVKTFPVNRSVLQSFKVAMGLFLWIARSKFYACYILGRNDLAINQVLESFLVMTNIPKITVRSVNGTSAQMRLSYNSGLLRIFCKEVVPMPFIFLFVWTGMSILFLYFLLVVKQKRRKRLYSPKVQNENHADFKLRLCLVSKEYPPITAGLGSFTWEMAKGLASLGHEVHVLTQGERNETLRESDVTVHYFKPCPKRLFRYIRMAGFLEAGYHLENSYWVSMQLKKLVKQYRFDVIEFSETRAEGFFFNLKRNRPPYVVRFHTSEGFCHQLNAMRFNFDRLWVRMMETFWIVRASAAIGISKDIVAKYRNFYNLDLSEVPNIPNPIDLTYSLGPNQASDAQPMVLFVGRFEVRKGPHIFAKAIPLILARLPMTEFYFVGNDSGLKRVCEEFLVESGAMHKVRLVDKIPRDEVYRHYAQTAVCVFPSLWENFPYTCLEAMAMGCPVVASNVGGFAEIIVNGQSGILVEPGDPEALADAVCNLLEQKELREAFGSEGPKRVRYLCDPLKVAELTLDVYRGVA